ncbi:hypothetical protein IWW54_002345 [Coemansia sp. RSA 2705]|nr:hypothetical protein IWW54_002345 [Coemansia sp. RSA 2705]
MEHIDFYKQFPLLIPESLDPLKANGYIEVAEVSIDATVTRGTYGTNVVKSTPDITQFLCGKKHELDARFQQCTSGLAFAKELQHSLKCEQLQECWDLLDDVDSTLCVLQPQHPKRFELWRRIAVSNLATALVETSPDRLVPKIICVRTNIETMLELQLPEKLSFDQQDLKLDCGICFAFNSNGETADQLCTSDMCAQPFHRTCLVQWLASKEDTRQSLTTLFGKCPYCSGKGT